MSPDLPPLSRTTPRTVPLSRAVVLATAAALTAAAITSLAWWLATRPRQQKTYTLPELNKLLRGLNQDQVREKLGAPDVIDSGRRPGSAFWHYKGLVSGHGRETNAAVSFEDGRVEEVLSEDGMPGGPR